MALVKWAQHIVTQRVCGPYTETRADDEAATASQIVAL